jgi:hypothetical protein
MRWSGPKSTRSVQRHERSLSSIHRSAWKGNSANFAGTEFYEGRRFSAFCCGFVS